jgi:hypothetical protein
MYPAGEARVRADAVTLSFSPIEGGASYGVAVEAVDGSRVFEQQTNVSPVPIPIGILKPATPYYWTVRTVDSAGASARGQAAFATLSIQDAQAREAVRASLEAEGEARSLGLLAQIDRRLGLLDESRADLRRAVNKSPDDPALREALAQLEQQMARKRH